jgi:hypothetical protein
VFCGVELVNFHVAVGSLLRLAGSTPPLLVGRLDVGFDRSSLREAGQLLDCEGLELDHQGGEREYRLFFLLYSPAHEGFFFE